MSAEAHFPREQPEVKRRSIKQRLAQGADYESICAIPGCGRPTMRAAGIGLAAFHCRRCIERRARSGSLFHPGYRGAELKPYLAAATSYLRPRLETDQFIKAAIEGIRLLLEQAGPTEIATRLKGMTAEKRARIAFARLRVAGVKPERMLAIVVAVNALIEDDPKSHRVTDFRITQSAKALHRRSSGTHKRYPYVDHMGRQRQTELHAYPRSSGPVLRLIGKAVEKVCELVVDKHLAAILAMKRARYGEHPARQINL